MPENNPHLPVVTNRQVVQLDVVGSLFGGRTINRFYYMSPGPADPAPVSGTFCNDFWDAVKAGWTNAVSLDWSLVGILFRRVNIYGLAPQVVLAGGLTGPFVGSRLASCPPADCVVIKRRTSLIGKRARGRVYIAGVAENDHENGMLTATGLTNFGGLVVTLASGINHAGVNYQPSQVYWTHTPVGGGGIANVEGEVIFATDVDPIIRTQRRRQVGVGQ